MPPFKDGLESTSTVLTADPTPQLMGQKPAVAADRLEYFLTVRGGISCNISGPSALVTAHSLDQYR